MAQVKLFRVTEFAESVFPSPLAHRTALHPLWAMLALALWITALGHLPLWRTLWASVERGQAGVVWLLGVAGQVFLLALAVLALIQWRGVFKGLAAVLLVWTALGGCVMALRSAGGEAMALTPGDLLQFVLNPASQHRLFDWHCLLAVAVTGFLPAVLLFRVPLRRLPPVHAVLLNALVLVATCGLLLGFGGLLAHAIGSPIDWRGLLR